MRYGFEGQYAADFPDVNNSINKQLRRITELLGWDIKISNTWARHSYSTNLRDAGVDYNYIRTAMAHNHSNDVTQYYMAPYPLKTMIENNKKLLNIDYKDESIQSEADGDIKKKMAEL